MDPRVRAYFEQLDPSSPLYAAEARDHARRLRAAVPLEQSWRCLDFGCGPGLVAAELAPYVAEVALWDPSPSARPWAETVATAHPALHLIDLAHDVPRARFDLILMNSVAQYLDDDALAAELGRLASALAPGGRIVVSDVPPRDRNLTAEVLELLRFAAGEGVLVAVVREYVRVWAAYRRMLREGGLVARDRADLQRLAALCGLRAEILAANLTHRCRRLSAVLRPSTAP